MVVKIQPPARSLDRVIAYNDRKVDLGDCDAVGVWNTGTMDIDRSYAVLEAYARGSRRTRDVVFHASVNPSVTDNMDRHTALCFIKDLMTGLGYGRQPMVIFEHNDTGRRHWHIVSVRVDRDGYKISDRYENYRCLDIVKDLQSKYHYTVGRDPSESRNPAEYDLTLDLTQRIEKALKYRCTTTAQLRAVLETLGVKVVDSPSGIQFQMLGKDRKPKSGLIDADDLMIPAKEEVERMVSRNRNSGDDAFRRKARVNGCVKAAMAGCRSEDEFRRRLSPKGIDVVFSRTDEGRIFGVTFIDHTTRSVLKGSELEKGLSASSFEDLVNGQWKSAAEASKMPQEAASRTQVVNDLSVGQELAIAAVKAASDAGVRKEHDIPRKRRRKRRI